MSLIKLSPAFTMRLPIAPEQSVGVTPTGNRSYIYVKPGGTFTLPDGSVPAIFSEGGDYAIIGPDGFGRLDVRAHAKTVDTNELLYITYSGHLEITPAVANVLGQTAEAKSTTFDDHKIFIQLSVETAAKAFAWMNRTIFVGRGRFEVEDGKFAIIYDVYKASG